MLVISLVRLQTVLMSGSQYNAAMFRTCMGMVKEGVVSCISIDHRLL